jgi:hypothetical protein
VTITPSFGSLTNVPTTVAGYGITDALDTNDARLTNERVPTDGSVTNAKVASNAAIALTKLATGALPTAITVESANIVDGTIVNADINASAAIALTKLATGALPTAITVASANIVDGTIVDADISGSAAIALSKLATGALPTAITVASANIVDGTIVNTDVSASAAIAGSKVAPDFGAQEISGAGLTLTGDLTFSRTNPAGITVTTAGVVTIAADTANTAAASQINFNVDGLEVCDINNGGSLRFSRTNFASAGICTQELDNLLNIAGGANAQNSGINLELSGPDRVSTIGMRIRWNTNNLYEWEKTSDFHRWFTGASAERMRLNDAGNLIVGATTSDHRFRVNGTIQCDATLRVGSGLTRNTTPVNSNTSTTATAASLLTGIRTGTPAANIDLQVPTGTDLDAAFVSLANNQTLEWTVINLASATHAITVTANTDHTVVGNMVVAAASSARFASRKTAANTFITYRIGS